MSKNALRTIWSFIGLATFGFAFTSVLRTTGSAVEANLLPLGTNDPYSAALVAFPILTLLIGTLLYVTLRYCRHSDVRGRDPWETRVPTFYFDDEDVNPASSDGRVYQRAIAFAFLLAPLTAQCVLALKCFNGTAFGPGGEHFASGWEHFWPDTAADLSDVAGGRYRFGEASTGVSYFPWVSPYLYAASLIVTIAGGARVWREVMTMSRKARKRAPADCVLDVPASAIDKANSAEGTE